MDAWLSRTVDRIWDSAPHKPPFPRDLREFIPLSFRVAVTELKSLSVFSAQAWLAERGVQHRLLCADRPLRGCVVAGGGNGLILLSADDPEDERRFTLAHEFAHYYLDYHQPREAAAAAMGAGILDVLDGHRDPTPEERISAALDRAPLGVYFNLLPRGRSGDPVNSAIIAAESRADELALELLAPARLVRKFVASSDAASNEARRTTAAEHLTEYFGLPARAASTYSCRLFPARNLRTAEWLGL